MSEGRHKAYVEVRDADGNVASRELEFTLGAEPRLLSLRLLGEAAREEALFETLGMNGETQLVITDSSGRRITSIPVNGDLTRWDLNDSEGHLVPPGLYRAFMREARGSADGMHSEAVFVPVVVASGAE